MAISTIATLTKFHMTTIWQIRRWYKKHALILPPDIPKYRWRNLKVTKYPIHQWFCPNTVLKARKCLKWMRHWNIAFVWDTPKLSIRYITNYRRKRYFVTSRFPRRYIAHKVDPEITFLFMISILLVYIESTVCRYCENFLYLKISYVASLFKSFKNGNHKLFI